MVFFVLDLHSKLKIQESYWKWNTDENDNIKSYLHHLGGKVCVFQFIVEVFMHVEGCGPQRYDKLLANNAGSEIHQTVNATDHYRKLWSVVTLGDYSCSHYKKVWSTAVSGVSVTVCVH